MILVILEALTVHTCFEGHPAIPKFGRSASSWPQWRAAPAAHRGRCLHAGLWRRPRPLLFLTREKHLTTEPKTTRALLTLEP